MIRTEIYINADNIEAILSKKGSFNFNAYRIKTNELTFHQHVINSGLYKKKLKGTNVQKMFSLKSGILTVHDSTIHSYHASFIATYMVECLLMARQSCCFETVLSHPDKIKYISIANNLGYKTYLYTSDENINIERVVSRHQQGKHFVDPTLIRNRFYRSLKILKQLMQQVFTVYLIDNSSFMPEIIFHRRGAQVVMDRTKSNFIQKYM